MVIPPAVTVHGLGHARIAVALGIPVTLLSAPGAALSAGCGWWQALIAVARSEYPATQMIDILDCADCSGQAMAALRIGLLGLVIWPSAPGRVAVAATAAKQGGLVLEAAPRSLDLAHHGSHRRLLTWLRAVPRLANGDNTAVLG
jgi:hypothetical protein